ncbi:MAG: DoxX family protein [Anaerolineae bacterium]|nr:DoxX family protein [Anaerolineae bacterium]
MLLVLKSLVTFVFVVAAFQKLTGKAAANWTRWGYSRQVMVATGIAEVVAVALLWWPGLTLVGAALMGMILMGALGTLVRYHESLSHRLLPGLSLVMVLTIVYLAYPV